MAKVKMTINPQNWCDDSAEIEYDEAKKTLKVCGNILKLSFLKQGNFECLSAALDGQVIASAFHDPSVDEYISIEGDVQREHKNPYILMAIMACNLL